MSSREYWCPKCGRKKVITNREPVSHDEPYNYIYYCQNCFSEMLKKGERIKDGFRLISPVFKKYRTFREAKNRRKPYEKTLYDEFDDYYINVKVD